MTWSVIIILLLVGLLFILLEILVIPGVGVAGILGTVLIIFTIWQTYKIYGFVAGHYTLASTLVFTILLLYFSFKSKTWKKMMLNSKIEGKVNTVDEKKLKVGDVGKTISRLAPAGKGLFNGEYYEVHSQGDFIDPGKEIIIVKINFNKIIVKLKK